MPLKKQKRCQRQYKAREPQKRSGLSEHGSDSSSNFKRSRSTRHTFSQVRELGETAFKWDPAWLRSTWPTMNAAQGGKDPMIDKGRYYGFLALGTQCKAG